jgi:hypothetical protein
MKIMLALGALPVAVIWIASTPRPAAVKAVEVEGITARRMDEGTFRARWNGVSAMPPLREIVVEPVLLVHHEAGTVASSPPAPPPSRHLGAARIDERQTVGATVSARPHQTRTAALRTDICARHGQRKVMVGKYRWRCRR